MSASPLSLEEKRARLARLLAARAERAAHAPASFQQQRLWFLDRLAPDQPAYHIAWILHLRGPLEETLARRVLDEIVRRHESLRTTFRYEGDALVQVVGPPRHVEMSTFDLRALPEGAREREVERRAMAQANVPFDLEEGPLLRAALLRLEDERHAACVTMHHLVADGWSLGIFAAELAALYGAFAAGLPSPLPDLPIQYGDYARWQRQHLRGEVLERLEDYWTRQLGDAPQVLDLPADRPRTPGRGRRGAVHRHTLTAAFTARLDDASRRAGVTRFMWMLTAYGVLLSRYTEQKDMVVGSPVAGRDRHETQPLIGFFANTLALRLDLRDDPTFEAALRRTRKTVLDALAHQEMPFEHLITRLGVQRDLHRPPLVQVAFAPQPLAYSESAASPFAVSLTLLAPYAPAVDLSVELGLQPDGGLDLRFVYDAALFDAATVERLAGHYERLLTATLAEADRPVSALPLMNPAEQRQVVSTWNATDADVPAPFVHELFAEQAARTPGHEALAFGKETMTYAELNARANRLAHHLRSGGVGPEQRVGLLLERSPDVVVGLLAILKAGGVYVPLDPAYPAERLRLMLADAGVRTVLTRDALTDALPPDPALSVVSIDRDAGRIARAPATKPDVDLHPDHLAYVIYTSGSTGRPKGTMITHGAFRNLALVQRSIIGLGPGDRVLQVVALTFDASLWDVTLALLSGAALHLAAEEERLPGPAMMRVLREHAVTMMTAPPSLLALLPEEPLPDLKVIVSTGEVCPASVVSRWAEGRRFYNGYGPTEVTVGATIGRCLPDGRPPGIGRPFTNAQTYVLDEAMRPVPVGLPGELYVGGAGLARGYLGQPALTAERFVPDPFGAPGGRLYRTGDRCRWRADGTLAFLGRNDEQVKIRGHRIEPGEVAAVLRRHPAVYDAVAVVREDRAGEPRLAAYVTPQPEAALDVRALERFAATQLPAYLVPSTVQLLDRLPRLPSGKVDVRALPAPAPRPADRPPFAAPQTPTEAVVADAFAEALGVQPVGAHDDFFALGGHSLLAVRIAARLPAHLGREVPLALLFAHPTPARLAAALDGEAAVPTEAEAPDLRAEAVLDPAIRPFDAAPPPEGPPHRVFLTGATGFLGAFLLRDLLVHTDARIDCLVRAEDEKAGWRRLERTLRKYELWEQARAARADERVDIVPGDLSRPLFGLAPERFDALARTSEAIYHVAASVSRVHGYHALKAPNVKGTEEVVRLAARHRITPLHYVSTLGVFPVGYAEREATTLERDRPEETDGVLGGYAQSKWVAEHLVWEAAARGLPVRVYRPGRITGDSTTGAGDADVYLMLALQAGIRMGSLPRLDAPIDVTPADYASRAILELSRRPAADGATYHLINPHPLPRQELLAVLAEFGHEVDFIPPEAWQDALPAFDPDGALSVWNALLEPMTPWIAANVHQFDCSETLKALAETPVRCPPADRHLLRTYLGRLVEQEHLGRITPA